MAGLALLLAGPPGTAKTAFSLGISQELGSKVAVGDIIYIESNSEAFKRVGRSDAFATEFDLEVEEYVPLPKVEVHKKKEIVQERPEPEILH